jgi:hypothetical protein
MRKQSLEQKRLYIHEETACRRMTSFTKFTELKDSGILLHKLTCKWEMHVEENGARFREGWSGGITHPSTLFYRIITLQNRRNIK